MSGRIVPHRGDVWLANLDATLGSEIRKTRPCLIVSPSELNDHLRTVLVAPLTSGSRDAPFRINLRFQERDGRILLDQMRTLDRQRLVRRLGQVDAAILGRTLATLRDLFAE